jgi:hypothetical protein
MINIKDLFKKRPDLLAELEVKKLIEHTKELEGEIFEKKIEKNYDKNHMLKSMLQDILSSCKEYEENKILEERYPELYKKVEDEKGEIILEEYTLDKRFSEEILQTEQNWRERVLEKRIFGDVNELFVFSDEDQLIKPQTAYIMKIGRAHV